MSDQQQSELHKTKIIKRLFLFLFLFSSTLLSHGKHIGQGDEPHYLVIAHSLFFDQDLDLSNNYSRTNLIGDGNLIPERHAILGRGGVNVYSIHSVGMPLIWAPLFGVVYKTAEIIPNSTLKKIRLTKWTYLRLIIALSMILLSCLLAIQTYIFLSKIIAPRFALIAVSTCFMSIPLLPMSFLFFTEIPAAFLAFQSYRLTYENSRGKYSFAAISAAFLPFLHVKYFILSAVLFSLLFKHWRKSVIIFATSILLLVLLNYYLWGSIMPYAAYGQNPLSLRSFWQGILGLFLDQEFGLLWFSPIYLLVPAGWYLINRKNHRTAGELLLMAAPTIIVSAAYPMWWGGWSPAGRFLAPATIFLIPFICAALEAFWKFRSGRFIVCAFLTFQFALAFIFWMKPKLMWNYGDGESELYSWLINGYTYSLPSLITVSSEDLLPGILWGATAVLIAIGSFLAIRKSELKD